MSERIRVDDDGAQTNAVVGMRLLDERPILAAELDLIDSLRRDQNVAEKHGVLRHVLNHTNAQFAEIRQFRCDVRTIGGEHREEQVGPGAANDETVGVDFAFHVLRIGRLVELVANALRELDVFADGAEELAVLLQPFTVERDAILVAEVQEEPRFGRESDGIAGEAFMSGAAFVAIEIAIGRIPGDFLVTALVSRHATIIGFVLGESEVASGADAHVNLAVVLDAGAVLVVIGVVPHVRVVDEDGDRLVGATRALLGVGFELKRQPGKDVDRRELGRVDGEFIVAIGVRLHIDPAETVPDLHDDPPIGEPSRIRQSRELVLAHLRRGGAVELGNGVEDHRGCARLGLHQPMVELVDDLRRAAGDLDEELPIEGVGALLDQLDTEARVELTVPERRHELDVDGAIRGASFDRFQSGFHSLGLQGGELRFVHGQFRRKRSVAQGALDHVDGAVGLDVELNEAAARANRLLATGDMQHLRGRDLPAETRKFESFELEKRDLADLEEITNLRNLDDLGGVSDGVAVEADRRSEAVLVGAEKLADESVGVAAEFDAADLQRELPDERKQLARGRPGDGRNGLAAGAGFQRGIRLKHHVCCVLSFATGRVRRSPAQ